MIDSPVWVGKIEKECRALAHDVKRMMDIVDHFWHDLESRYNLTLENRKAIVRLITRQVVANEIRQHFTYARQTYPDMSKVLRYLRTKVP